MLKQIASVDDIYLQKENIMHRFLLLQVIQPFFIRTIYLKLVQMIEVHGIKVSEIDKVRKAGVTPYAGLSTGKDEHRSSN